MRITYVLRFPRRKYAELGYLRHLPQEYIEKLKMAVPKKIYDNRLGAPPIIRWKVHPDDQVPETKPWFDPVVVQNTIRREKSYHRAQLSTRFYEKQIHNVKQIPREEWMFFPGDKVQVMVGKDKGRQGTVHRVLHESNCIYVEGMHTIKIFHEAAKMTTDEEQPLFVDKGQVMLVDPTDTEPCNAKWILNADGTDYIRVSDRTSCEIPIPKSAHRTTEYYTPEAYIEVDDKDTPAAAVLRKTYQPKLCTFEQDIMEEEGIVEDREYQPTYWY